MLNDFDVGTEPSCSAAMPAYCSRGRGMEVDKVAFGTQGHTQKESYRKWHLAIVMCPFPSLYCYRLQRHCRSRALPPNCSTLQQQTSCELPLSVLLKSTAAFASEKRGKNWCSSTKTHNVLRAISWLKTCIDFMHINCNRIAQNGDLLNSFGYHAKTIGPKIYSKFSLRELCNILCHLRFAMYR